jgi:hypothetical protein
MVNVLGVTIAVVWCKDFKLSNDVVCSYKFYARHIRLGNVAICYFGNK